ncbi:type II secretion system inner membrane protein GspF [Acidiferrobacter sp.]|uniref:type II secretion system inner membrane protein GspF n=1 Tax=Acidiferrobacter sp. TaxID=1872107 RepID=UPI002633E6C4|nr:type II secretion system inner membrane protein GspF [Acidiferrobacter sp.]
MTAFEYEALCGDGRAVTGVMEGDAERVVRALLRERGLVPVRVAPIVPRPARPRPWGGQDSLGAAELALITRELATLVAAGLPIEEALQALTEHAGSGRARKILAAIRARVREGQALAQALGDVPGVFPPLYRHLVAAGEQSGKLPVILERLADYTEQRQALTQRLRAACLYPALVAGVAIMIAGGLLVYVVPRITQVFVDSGAPLPWATRALIAGSALVRRGGVLWPVIIAATVLTGRWLLQDRKRRCAWHGVWLRVPLFGRLIRGVNAARLASTLAMLAGSGIPLLAALDAAMHVVSNLPMRDALDTVRREVREGGPLGHSLARTRLFPPLVIRMIESGEASGSLDTMLARAAAAQTREIEGLAAILTGLMEPLLTLVMGAIVLFIVLAILMPIFDMNQLIK